jgi:hypothetical protein
LLLALDDMHELSSTTLQMLQRALDEGADQTDPAATERLREALARVREETGGGSARAADLMRTLRTTIVGLRSVREASTETERIDAVRRVTEACVAAYYDDGK